MPLPTDHHIVWSRVEPARHRHRLCESDVDAPDLEAMGLPWQAPLPAPGHAIQPELEHAIGGLWAAPGGRVLLTAGGSEANAIVFGALLERGEEVLVETPGYEPHREVPRLFGVTVRRFVRPLGQGSLAAAVDQALGPETRMVVVTHPHNPSGEPIAPAALAALDALAKRRNLWILCDEIFRDAIPEARGTFAALGPRWITTSSLTKVYGLGGLRLGWIAGTHEVRTRCATVQNALSASPSVPSMALALALVPHLDALRARSQAMIAANRTRWEAIVAAGVPCTVPVQAHGTTAWALLPGEGEGDAFAAFASQRERLALTPGRFFSEPRGFRVALGGEPARCAPAFDALARALEAHASAPSIPRIEQTTTEAP
ncbi:MAG TPA: pyridoxal phosphate-dependent aminotransferase [Candidatus Eisenbacteria bacterium]|nr:pyridoxal phosphate-dependent aminotransferase [Candidatus Eisenbacteria bacterium]